MEKPVVSFEDRSKEKIKRYLQSEIEKLFKGIMDYAEVAVDSKDRWKVLRSRILKVSNDTIRTVNKEIDSKYTIKYVPPAEDVVVFKK